MSGIYLCISTGYIWHSALPSGYSHMKETGFYQRGNHLGAVYLAKKGVWLWRCVSHLINPPEDSGKWVHIIPRPAASVSNCRLFFILPALKVGGRRTGSAWRPLGESLEQIHIEYSTRFPGRISPVVYGSREVLFALDDERLYQAD